MFWLVFITFYTTIKTRFPLDRLTSNILPGVPKKRPLKSKTRNVFHRELTLGNEKNVFGKSDRPKGNTRVETIKLNEKHSGK